MTATASQVNGSGPRRAALAVAGGGAEGRSPAPPSDPLRSDNVVLARQVRDLRAILGLLSLENLRLLEQLRQVAGVNHELRRRQLSASTRVGRPGGVRSAGGRSSATPPPTIGAGITSEERIRHVRRMLSERASRNP